MRQKIVYIALFIVLAGVHTFVRAQSADIGIRPNLAGGEVMSVSQGKLVLQTKDGAIDVVLTDKTEYKRVSAEKPSLQTATAASFTDIGAGDKILVTGAVSTDKKSVPAKAVYLMTKSDIAQKQNRDLQAWQTRGIVGQVSAVNAEAGEITVSIRGLMGETKTIVTPKDNAVFRRYAQDSVDYNKSRVSTLSEIRVGDSIRALGDRGTDGATYRAEEIISGAFQTIGGTITAIDADKKEITIENFQTKKPVTVVVGENSILKQFPAEMAQRMVAMQSGGAGGMQPPQGVRPPQQANPNAAQNPNAAGPGGGMRGGGSFDEMIDRFPTIAVADLKVGDMIAFSSSKGNMERVTAIKLLSGVEPFIKMSQASGARRGGQGGQDGGFSIPGLDGAGFP